MFKPKILFAQKHEKLTKPFSSTAGASLNREWRLLRGRIKKFCHFPYTFYTICIPFWKFESYFIKVTSINVDASLHLHDIILQFSNALWSRYGLHLWMDSFRKVMCSWERSLMQHWRADLIFGIQPKIARCQVGWVWRVLHQTDTIFFKIRLREVPSFVHEELLFHDSLHCHDGFEIVSKSMLLTGCDRELSAKLA